MAEYREPNTASILQSEQLAPMLAAVSPAGMVVVDGGGKIVYANPQISAWLGYADGELVGSSVDTLVPSMARQQHASYRNKFAQAPKPREMAKESDLFAQRKDGSLLAVDISLHPFMANACRYVLANVLDATQRRAAAKLPQERLKAIGEMVAGLAHESRNALQRARASLDLLQLDLESNEDHCELLRRIRNSLEELEHNYDEVRNYAAPINLDASEVAVDVLVHDVVAELGAEFDDLPQVNVECQPHEATNYLDRHRIKQVIRNCLENASQATVSPESHAILVKIWLEAGEQIIEFIDRGEGLSDDVARKMFEPFFTTKQKGTGLGLAICRRISDAHEGKISAAANELGGTTVQLRLPYRL